MSLIGRMLDSSMSKRLEDLAPMIAMMLVAMTGFACYLPF